MKRFTLLSLLLATAAGSIFAQQKNEKTHKAMPGAAVQSAFEKAFPGASKVKWDKEGKTMEANFVQQNHEMSATYNSAGQLLETEISIPVGQLPAAVTMYVKQHYPGTKIQEAAKITKANGTVQLEAEVRHRDLIFDEQGKFLREERD